MPSLEEIMSQIKNLDGASKLLGRKEIRELPSILWEDEGVEKLVQGAYNNGVGILVATNKRLIFVDKGMLYGLKVEDFPYDKISSIQYETKMIFGKITIFASGNKAVIEQTAKAQARDFCDTVRALVSSGAKEHASAPSKKTGNNIVDQLKELAALRDQGILTEDEFQAQKKKMLG